jgi:hypothetical protein
MMPGQGKVTWEREKGEGENQSRQQETLLPTLIMAET